jgi:hypothetical protein
MGEYLLRAGVAAVLFIPWLAVGLGLWRLYLRRQARKLEPPYARLRAAGAHIAAERGQPRRVRWDGREPLRVGTPRAASGSSFDPDEVHVEEAVPLGPPLGKKPA